MISRKDNNFGSVGKDPLCGAIDGRGSLLHLSALQSGRIHQRLVGCLLDRSLDFGLLDFLNNLKQLLSRRSGDAFLLRTVVKNHKAVLVGKCLGDNLIQYLSVKLAEDSLHKF